MSRKPPRSVRPRRRATAPSSPSHSRLSRSRTRPEQIGLEGDRGDGAEPERESRDRDRVGRDAARDERRAQPVERRVDQAAQARVEHARPSAGASSSGQTRLGARACAVVALAAEADDVGAPRSPVGAAAARGCRVAAAQAPGAPPADRQAREIDRAERKQRVPGRAGQGGDEHADDDQGRQDPLRLDPHHHGLDREGRDVADHQEGDRRP